MMRLENVECRKHQLVSHSHIHYRVIRGRFIYWASGVEPRESGSSVGRGETPKIHIGGVRREEHTVGRWAGRTERALARRHDCLDTAEVESYVAGQG